MGNEYILPQNKINQFKNLSNIIANLVETKRFGLGIGQIPLSLKNIMVKQDFIKTCADINKLVDEQSKRTI